MPASEDYIPDDSGKPKNGDWIAEHQRNNLINAIGPRLFLHLEAMMGTPNPRISANPANIRNAKSVAVPSVGSNNYGFPQPDPCAFFSFQIEWKNGRGAK